MTANMHKIEFFSGNVGDEALKRKLTIFNASDWSLSRSLLYLTKGLIGKCIMELGGRPRVSEPMIGPLLDMITRQRSGEAALRAQSVAVYAYNDQFSFACR